MVLIQLLLPLRDNGGRPFDRAMFERVRSELTDRFGGVTAFLQSPASGVWREQGETMKDELILFETMVERLDPAWWGRYRQELEVRFRQESIVVRALEAQRL